ncbi:MAG TPA: ABC transporter ATP-binding protein [Bacteroidales bacterium]|nr:MAG: Lipoprotein-releasing system ATP-binding protein LolD [Bacteroidetes bacterium ADurb.Bin217]HPH15694.1 ABC transporter ATP-binding protein [Bacteroidales bacterium]
MILTTTQIHKSFGDVQVLKGIDIAIAEGEVVSIVGKSGAGKTTLLHIAGTLLKADSGDISILNTEISKLKEKQLARFRNEHIGFVFQFHQLLPEFTALENVCIPSLIQGKSMSESHKRAKELLDFLGISHRIEHKPAQLSGGEQQRVAVARALMNKPSIIFADEPSGNLDSKHKTELHELFFTLRKEFNQTFIIVTHDSTLAQLSDRTITMEDGNIIG